MTHLYVGVRALLLRRMLWCDTTPLWTGYAVDPNGRTDAGGTMGERRPGRDHELRLTMAEAAEVLGTSKDAIRMRVRRGSLRSEKGEDGRRYVFVEPVRGGDRNGDPGAAVEHPTSPAAAREELVEELRDQVRHLREQLAHATDRDRENRRIIAALTQRIPEIEAPASPAASQEPSGAPESAFEGPERVSDWGARQGAQNGSERVPWWRRVFGG